MTHASAEPFDLAKPVTALEFDEVMSGQAPKRDRRRPTECNTVLDGTIVALTNPGGVMTVTLSTEPPLLGDPDIAIECIRPV